MTSSYSLLLVQAVEPGWVGPVAALSLLVIALVAVGLCAAAILTARMAMAQTRELTRTVREIHADLAPALQALKGAAEDGRALSSTVREEVEGTIQASRRLRGQVESGVARVGERLGDFDALIQIVYDELHETALDLAALLRSTRRGFGLAGGIRRIFSAGRRRLKRKAR